MRPARRACGTLPHRGISESPLSTAPASATRALQQRSRRPVRSGRRRKRRAIRIRSRRGTRWHRGHNEPCCPPQGRSTRCRRTTPDGIWSLRPRVVPSARNGARRRARYDSACRGRSGWWRPPPDVPERRSLTDTTARRPRRPMAPREPALRQRQGQDVSRSATVSEAGGARHRPRAIVRSRDSPLRVARSGSARALCRTAPNRPWR
jgi:hypothetical protein